MSVYNREVVKKWDKKIPTELFLLDVCREYWRTREEINKTPQYVIDLIAQKNHTDLKISKMKHGK